MKYLVLCGCSALAFSGLGQEVIASQGDSYNTANGSVDFTIGETVIETVSDGNYDLTQGFHQTHWDFLGVDDYAPLLSYEVFPNPMTNELVVRGETAPGTLYQLYDAQGKLILEGALDAAETHIAVQALAPGAYALQLRQADSILKNFKLVKHQ